MDLVGLNVVHGSSHGHGDAFGGPDRVRHFGVRRPFDMDDDQGRRAEQDCRDLLWDILGLDPLGLLDGERVAATSAANDRERRRVVLDNQIGDERGRPQRRRVQLVPVHVQVVRHRSSPPR
ncbi:hypothetical protein [Curtobacterium sp. VKM Ac-1395]|uniref:hypothetical protein n=1 Tax=Curtobacterium sp. VKM Ac-1395 TaxID=2783815 RepID=UPI00188B38DB|nr:hypothetical protein [Curtobacterium sp. VKM Ac-1395]MBF4588699.1 hypothetical protein [Curtobacterium sp. VKM Ac-1395]